MNDDDQSRGGSGSTTSPPNSAIPCRDDDQGGGGGGGGGATLPPRDIPCFTYLCVLDCGVGDADDEDAPRGSSFRAAAQQIPGISFKTSGPGQTEFEMRGLTSTGGESPTVGFYLDDAMLTPAAMAQTGPWVRSWA